MMMIISLSLNVGYAVYCYNNRTPPIISFCVKPNSNK